jgi:hypothetical protein
MSFCDSDAEFCNASNSSIFTIIHTFLELNSFIDLFNSRRFEARFEAH